MTFARSDFLTKDLPVARIGRLKFKHFTDESWTIVTSYISKCLNINLVAWRSFDKLRWQMWSKYCWYGFAINRLCCFSYPLAFFLLILSFKLLNKRFSAYLLIRASVLSFTLPALCAAWNMLVIYVGLDPIRGFKGPQWLPSRDPRILDTEKCCVDHMTIEYYYITYRMQLNLSYNALNLAATSSNNTFFVCFSSLDC